MPKKFHVSFEWPLTVELNEFSLEQLVLAFFLFFIQGVTLFSNVLDSVVPQHLLNSVKLVKFDEDGDEQLVDIVVVVVV